MFSLYHPHRNFNVHRRPVLEVARPVEQWIFRLRLSLKKPIFPQSNFPFLHLHTHTSKCGSRITPGDPQVDVEEEEGDEERNLHTHQPLKFREGSTSDISCLLEKAGCTKIFQCIFRAGRRGGAPGLAQNGPPDSLTPFRALDYDIDSIRLVWKFWNTLISRPDPNPVDNNDGVRRSIHDLPVELLSEIFQLVMETEFQSTIGNHHLLLGPRGVSRGWRRLAEKMLWQSLHPPSRLFHRTSARDQELKGWYATGIRRWEPRYKVSLIASVDTITDLDTEYLENCIAAFAHCQRAEVKVNVTDMTLTDNFLPPISMLNVSPLPRSCLVDVSIKCPSLSIDDVYSLLRGARNTLEKASFGTLRADKGSLSPIISRHRATLKKLKSLSIEACSDVGGLFTSLNMPRLSSLGLRILPRYSGSTLFAGSDDDLAGEPPKLITELGPIWAQLHSLSMDIALDQSLKFVEIFSKCSSNLEALTWKARLEDLAPSPDPAHRSLSVLDLHTFWQRLTTLSLESRGPGSWPIGNILMRCKQLQTFEWKGEKSIFSADSQPLNLEIFKRLVVYYDEQALSDILRLSRGVFDSVTAPTCSSFISNSAWFLSVKSVVVRKTMTTSETRRMSAFLQRFMVEAADLPICTSTASPSSYVISSNHLRRLTLNMPQADSHLLKLLMERMLTQELEELKIMLPEKLFSRPTLEPFLNVSKRALLSTHCISQESKLELWEFILCQRQN